MDKGEEKDIGKKPPETHNAQRGFGFVIKAFFLYGDADEQYAHQGEYHTGSRMQAGRIVKRIDGDAQDKSKDE